MKVKELIEELKQFGQDKEVLIASDEELNSLFTKFQISDFEDKGKSTEIVIYGLSGCYREIEPLTAEEKAELNKEIFGEEPHD